MLRKERLFMELIIKSKVIFKMSRFWEMQILRKRESVSRQLPWL